ncbi:hypothetical protein [Halospeciosus flavus]|uniref:Uncharacterized protein n=1 Tax=Halospeciosus flavus TaxID=3032283 RepID=A0ABD5Z8M8_9EURY|nr:hypothetical protein [Halospeciosus flavus]
MAADTPETPAEDTDAADALADALDGVEGTPGCVVCPESADFYLFAAGRVSTFACWEHVSPYAALVDGRGRDGGGGEDETDDGASERAGDDAFAERPEAVRLDD